MKNYILIFLVISQTVWSQTKFRFGPEVGCASSLKYISLSTASRDAYISPYYSPLLGLTGELTVKKHFQLNVGLQYQRTAEYFHAVQTGTYFYTGRFEREEWTYQTFQKLCVPLSLGYTLKIGKVCPTFFVGSRLNYFTSGNYYTKTVFTYDVDFLNSNYEYQFKPLQPYSTFRRFNSQFYYGVSLLVCEHIKLTVSVCKGNVRYSTDPPSCFGLSFHNTDYIASISYLFYKKKKDTECSFITK